MIKRGGGGYIRNNDYSNIVTGKELFVQFIYNNDFIPSSCLYLIRKSFLKQSSIRFYEGILHEDELFTPEIMLKANRVSVRNKKIYIRRYREGSIMTKPIGIKNIRGMLSVLIGLTKLLTLYKDDEKTYTAIEKKVDLLFGYLISRFNQCSDEEKWKINQFSEEENKFFQLACFKAGISVQRDIKISVIVPIYNVEEYIHECLDSIVNQTLKDIEIILVDDCSTDNSGKIADEYAAQDERIIVIHKEKNESLLLARKTGVAHAQGKYTVFVDSDDFLTSKDSLKTAYDLIESKNVDIIHFTCDVYDNNNESRNNMLRYINRHVGKIVNPNNIILICFSEKKFNWTLWNKIYRTDICKRGYMYIENVYVNNAEDVYAFFLISFFANSFESIKSLPIYTYRKNKASISRKDIINIKDFCLINNSRDIAELLDNFLKSVYSYYEYRDIVKKIKSHLLRYSIEYGLYRIITTDINKAFSLLIHKNSIGDVISHLWMVYRWRDAELAKKVHNIDLIKVTKSEIKTIGIFYYRYYQGGVERGISIRIPMFLKMGYQVVLFTHEYKPELEYDLPKEVKREVLPKGYDQARAEVFLKAIQENKIDCIIYHQSQSDNILFDLLLVKTQGIPFVVFRHALAAHHLSELSNRINLLYHIYKLADKLIVLTRMDEQYYQSIDVNTKYLPNINSIYMIEEESYSQNDGVIIWVGRLDSEQKNYIDVIKIMERVVMYNNNVQLVMLGSEYDTNSANILKESIEKSHLQDNVKYIGPTLDTDIWYRKAKIHLVTSSWESWCRVINESKTYGIPLVTYSMPYLELLKDGKGYIEVPQGGIQEAADAIVKLLNDNELCEKLSREAKESIKPFMEFDHEKAWREIFEELVSPKTETSPTNITVNNENMKMLLETFGFHYEKGVEKYRDIERRYREQERRIAPVKNISSPVLNYLILCATARVDIKLSGSPDHKITIISCDSEVNYHVPEWIAKNTQGVVNGYGIVFESNTGKMEFSVQCESEGLFDVWLRGVDYRNNQGQRIPIFINYKKFTINGEEIFHDDTRISHDKSYHFQKNVKEKESITVSVSWYPDGYQEPPQK